MSKFLSYILHLRGAAIFFVVGVHSLGNVYDWSSQEEVFHLVSSFFESREGNGTVMFIFVGGFLFQYLNHHHLDFRKYIEKKFLYVISPYILISIPIIIFRIHTNYTSVMLPPGLNDHSIVYRFFYYLATGLHLAPFWFISAIVLFYISAPLLHALDRRMIYKYLFPFIFITCLFTYRSEHNGNPLLSYLHYFPVYMLGMWASFNRERILSTGNWLVWTLGLAYIVTSVITEYTQTPERITFEQVIRERLLLFNINMLRAIVLCFFLMLLLHRLRRFRMPLLDILGEYSFGIFFVHCVLIYGSRKLWETFVGPVHLSLATFIIYFLLILLASTAIVFFVKKLTGRYSRNLIGS